MNQRRIQLIFLLIISWKCSCNADNNEIRPYSSEKGQFYVERKLQDEDLDIIYYRYALDTNDLKLPNYICECFNETKSNETFEEYYQEFRNMEFSRQLIVINKIKESKLYQGCANRIEIFELPEWEIEKILTTKKERISSHTFYKLDFDQVLNEANKTKMLILSADAGAGKTATFEHFTEVLCDKLVSSFYLIAYIDLKRHTKLYNASGIFENFEGFMNNLFQFDSNFDKSYIWKTYKLGKLIFLWNGFDEISPRFTDFVLALLKFIRMNSTNIQFLSTRPLYSNQLKEIFKVPSFTLVPFDDQKQREFLTEYFKAQNIEEHQFSSYIEKVFRIINSTNTIQKFDTPFMLGMIAELLSIDETVSISENLFEIYQKFVKKKIEIWLQNSEFAQNVSQNWITDHHGYDLILLYQKYALKNEFSIPDLSDIHQAIAKLKVTRKKYPEALTMEEIFRMGILYINGPNNFDFVHKTFSEFFVAQYLVESIYLDDDVDSEEEIRLRIELFFKIVINPKEHKTFKRIKKFISYFLEATKGKVVRHFRRKISKGLRTYCSRIFFDVLQQNSLDTLYNLELIFNFFKKDRELLRDLLHVDGDETLYTAAYNFRYPGSWKMNNTEFDEFIDSSKNYLNPDDYIKFKTGKNQNGIILFSQYCFYRFEGKFFNNFQYTLPEKVLKSNNSYEVFEFIAKNITKPELIQLLKPLTSPVYIQSSSIRVAKNVHFWKFIEENLSRAELKAVVTEALEDPYLSFLKRCYRRYVFSSYCAPDDVKTFGEIVDELFTVTEIFELNVGNSYILSANAYRYNYFKNFTFEQRKSILSINKELKEREEYKYLAGEKLNLLHLSLLNDVKFHEKFKEIYAQHFNKSELQALVTSSIDFILRAMVNNNEICTSIANYLKTLFKGNEGELKEYLLRNVGDTEYNAFELLEDEELTNECYGHFNYLLNPLDTSNNYD